MGRQLRRTYLSDLICIYRKYVELAVDWSTLQCVTKGFSTGLQPIKGRNLWLSGHCQSGKIQFARQYVFQ